MTAGAPCVVLALMNTSVNQAYVFCVSVLRRGVCRGRVCAKELFVDQVGRVERLLAVLRRGSAAEDPNVPEPRNKRLVVRGHPRRKRGASLL